MLKDEIINLSVTVKYWMIQRWKYKAVGNEYINKEMTEEEYQALNERLYGNQYIKEKYIGDEERRLDDKRRVAGLIDKYLNKDKKHYKLCDAGANRGYLMKAFLEIEGRYDVYGFDILENLNEIIDSENDIIRKNYKLGSILDIPKFESNFDIVTSFNVFEHIPINYTDKMVNELLKLNPRYFVLEISKDVFSDGHITLKGTNFWVKKFKGYRVMKELGRELNEKEAWYRYCGIPRNSWNKCAGIIFLERVE